MATLKTTVKKLLDKFPSWASLLKWEPIAFAVLVIMGLIPVLKPHYFSTLDGPAHLYNAHLIKQMLFDDNQRLQDFFMFNTWPVPNWSGHAIMTFFITFLPDYLAEKAFLVIYLTLTPLFFRKLVLTFSPQNRIITWIGIPFAHHHLLYFGFYNMCTGLMFLFITIFFFRKYCEKLNWKGFIGLSLLLLCTYFSHITMYMLTLGLLGVFCIPHIRFKKPFWANFGGNITPVFKHGIATLVAAIPSLVLAINYIMIVHAGESYGDVPPTLKDALRFIFNIKPLITIRDHAPYTTYANLVFGLLAVLLLVGLYRFFKNRKQEFSPQQMPITLFKIVMALVTIVFLVLFFVMPNAILLTERLILIFYFLYILILAIPHYPKWAHLLVIAVIIHVHYQNSRHHRRTMAELSHGAVLIQDNANYMEEGSTVLTVNYIENWLFVHVRGYLGSSKPLIVVQNYEASLNWFPLRWSNKFNLERLDNWGSDTNSGIMEYYVHQADTTVFSLKRNDETLMPIDYFVVFEDSTVVPSKLDSRDHSIKRILDSSYQMVHQNHLSKLYKLRE